MDKCVVTASTVVPCFALKSDIDKGAYELHLTPFFYVKPNTGHTLKYCPACGTQLHL